MEENFVASYSGAVIDSKMVGNYVPSEVPVKMQSMQMQPRAYISQGVNIVIRSTDSFSQGRLTMLGNDFGIKRESEKLESDLGIKLIRKLK